MRILNIAIFLTVVSAISVSAQKVKVGADPAVDLTKYKTYSWTKGLAGSNAIVHALIVDAVDKEMAAKGMRKVDSDGELTVVGFVTTATDLYASQPSWAPGLNSINTGVVVPSRSVPVTEGTLIIDLLDAKSKNGVWRGTATHTLENGPTGNKAKDAKTVEKPIKKAVEKMFKQYPHPKK